jgi:hypothetical protein
MDCEFIKGCTYVPAIFDNIPYELVLLLYEPDNEVDHDPE